MTEKKPKNQNGKGMFQKERIVIAAVVVVMGAMFIIKQRMDIPKQNQKATVNLPETAVMEENIIPQEGNDSAKDVTAQEKTVPASDKITSEESAADYETSSEPIPQLLELGSDSCIPCMMMRPILAELTAEYEGQMVVKFIDVYENPDITRKYNIRGIPTQIFLDSNGKEVSRNVGFMPKDDILKRWASLGYEFTPVTPKEKNG